MTPKERTKLSGNIKKLLEETDKSSIAAGKNWSRSKQLEQTEMVQALLSLSDTSSDRNRPGVSSGNLQHDNAHEEGTEVSRHDFGHPQVPIY